MSYDHVLDTGAHLTGTVEYPSLMRRRVSEIGWSRFSAFHLTALLLAAVSIAVCSPRAARGDVPALPIYEGSMNFPAINGPSDPEDYSWQVELGANQELESIDDQHAEVYYTEGHHRAMGISAEPVHDAHRSTVPTTLSVSAGDVITLTVHHRAGDPLSSGAPFNYPIVAGHGPEGGFAAQVVVEPFAEPQPMGGAGSSRAPASSPCVSSSASCRRSRLRGHVGGPPTISLGRPDEGKRLTPDFVIGRGRTYRGPVELVAYGWLAPRDAIPSSPRKQFCVWVEYLPAQVNPGTCNRALDPEYEGKIAIDDGVQALGPPGGRYTEVGGRLAPEVASVQVSYHRRDHGLTVVDATVGRVTGNLQRKLHQPAPFGYFDATLPGLVKFSEIRARAFDGSGNLIGEDHG
jgi:hypothetical protein